MDEEKAKFWLAVMQSKNTPCLFASWVFRNAFERPKWLNVWLTAIHGTYRDTSRGDSPALGNACKWLRPNYRTRNKRQMPDYVETSMIQCDIYILLRATLVHLFMRCPTTIFTFAITTNFLMSSLFSVFAIYGYCDVLYAIIYMCDAWILHVFYVQLFICVIFQQLYICFIATAVSFVTIKESHTKIYWNKRNIIRINANNTAHLNISIHINEKLHIKFRIRQSCGLVLG